MWMFDRHETIDQFDVIGACVSISSLSIDLHSLFVTDGTISLIPPVSLVLSKSNLQDNYSFI